MASCAWSGDALAHMFMGEITPWNATEIVKLNPGVTLPDLAIKVVVHSDGAGTTYNVADYLSGAGLVRVQARVSCP